MKAICYARVSTTDQVNGIEAQIQALRQAAERHGWQYSIVQEEASGRTLGGRPVLMQALRELDAGDRLIVTTLSRLSRSVVDFGNILDRASRDGWGLVVCDMGGQELDTASAVGAFAARMLVEVAQLERELIAERTRAALQQVKARGVQLGHPSTVSPETKERIRALRESGMSWREVTKALNDEGVPSPSGKGKWYLTSVRRHCGNWADNLPDLPPIPTGDETIVILSKRKAK
ncbi:MAG: recombinase family protein [Anaerolineales bacterium]